MDRVQACLSDLVQVG